MSRVIFSAIFLSIMIAFGVLAAPKVSEPVSAVVKPSDVRLPEGVEFGSYRRIIQPYRNWTLTCDENLKDRQRICNVSQVIIDQSGSTLFSWSLAGTANGRPMMIFRVPAAVGANSNVLFAFPGRAKPVVLSVDRCDANICLGTTPVGPIFKEHIQKKSTVQISYGGKTIGNVSLQAPLNGLEAALAGL